MLGRLPPSCCGCGPRTTTAFPVRHAPDNGAGSTRHTRPETHQNHIHTEKEHIRTPHDVTNTGRSNGSTAFQARNATAQYNRQEHSVPDSPSHRTLDFHDTVSTRRSAPRAPDRVAFGGDDRDRTDDPLLAKQVLSQLSYAPNPELSPARRSLASSPPAPEAPHWWAREDLNLRPHAYQACALTN